MRLNWNGRSYRPASNYVKVYKPNINELIKPLSQKPGLGSAILTGTFISGIGDNYPPESPLPPVTPSVTPTNTPTVTPTNTSTPTPSITQTNTPTVTPTETSTPTPSVTATVTPSTSQITYLILTEDSDGIMTEADELIEYQY